MQELNKGETSLFNKISSVLIDGTIGDLRGSQNAPLSEIHLKFIPQPFVFECCAPTKKLSSSAPAIVAKRVHSSDSSAKNGDIVIDREVEAISIHEPVGHLRFSSYGAKLVEIYAGVRTENFRWTFPSDTKVHLKIRYVNKRDANYTTFIVDNDAAYTSNKTGNYYSRKRLKSWATGGEVDVRGMRNF